MYQNIVYFNKHNTANQGIANHIVLIHSHNHYTIFVRRSGINHVLNIKKLFLHFLLHCTMACEHSYTGIFTQALHQ